jgi:hypothetical protein
MTMKLSKKLIVPAAVMSIAVIPAATAAAATSTSSNNGQSLAQELADKFQLNKSDVQTVLDQHHQQMQQRRENRYEATLNQAVTDGKLTQAQKDAVLTEHNKLIAQVQSASGTDKRQALQDAKTEAQAWAKQNKIDAKWLLPMHGPGGQHTMGDQPPIN